MDELKKKLAEKLIDNVGQAHKLWSVRLTVLLGVVAGLETILPQLKAVLPENWIPAAALLIAVARLVKQETDKEGK